MNTRSRIASVVICLASITLFASCSSTPDAAVPSSAPVDSNAPSDPSFDEMSGVLLDEGRMIAVVTWGSSTCIPQVDAVTGNGQDLAVTLIDPDSDAVCTQDLVQRASVGALPAGVDPTRDITIRVTYGDVTDDIQVPGAPATGVPGESTDYAASASWIGDATLVLLTWGSSSCPPVVESLDGSGNTGTVTFLTDESKVCTADMAPRATLLTFDNDTVDTSDFTLTITGDNFDGTVSVR